MMIKQRTYIAIDIKSFYASVECLHHPEIREKRTWLWQIKAGLRKQFVLQYPQHLKVMEFPEDPGCLKLFRRSGKRTMPEDGMLRTGLFREYRMTVLCLMQIRN